MCGMGDDKYPDDELGQLAPVTGHHHPDDNQRLRHHIIHEEFRHVSSVRPGPSRPPAVGRSLKHEAEK